MSTITISTKTPILIILCLSIYTSFSQCKERIMEPIDKKPIEGMFVFGSSLVDNGNNNYLANLAKVNYLPYGIDFIYGPSGRFSNGKNVVDVLCEKLNLPYIPVFVDPTTQGIKVVHGVNFASGGSGILDDTGSIAGQVFNLNQQVQNFVGVTLPQLEIQLMLESNEFLQNYLFVVGTGGNDYTLNYFPREANGNNNGTSLDVFTSNLIELLSRQLKNLYNVGARKFVLLSVNPLGCYPSSKSRQPKPGECIQSLNKAAHVFNARLRSLVDTIKPEMQGSSLVFINSYKIVRDIIRFPSMRGFKDTSNPCCEVSSLTGILCKKDGKICEDRRSYVFFDGLHPTEAVNVQIANKAFYSNLLTEVYPFNVKQLSML